MCVPVSWTLIDLYTSTVLYPQKDAYSRCSHSKPWVIPSSMYIQFTIYNYIYMIYGSLLGFGKWYSYTMIYAHMMQISMSNTVKQPWSSFQQSCYVQLRPSNPSSCRVSSCQAPSNSSSWRPRSHRTPQTCNGQRFGRTKCRKSPRSTEDLRGFWLKTYEIYGSMSHRIHVWYIYIYANIWGILMVNVTIYSIHGSYGSRIYMDLIGS